MRNDRKDCSLRRMISLRTELWVRCGNWKFINHKAHLLNVALLVFFCSQFVIRLSLLSSKPESSAAVSAVRQKVFSA